MAHTFHQTKALGYSSELNRLNLSPLVLLFSSTASSLPTSAVIFSNWVNPQAPSGVCFCPMEDEKEKAIVINVWRQRYLVIIGASRKEKGLEASDSIHVAGIAINASLKVSLDHIWRTHPEITFDPH